MSNQENSYMPAVKPIEVGRLVQEYVRAKWHRPGFRGSAQEAGERLDPQLRERVDLLGNDDELLLEVPAEDVLQRIDELETMAAAEDAGITDAVERVRAGEEARMGRKVLGGQIARTSYEDRRRKRH
jgi:hypothetical protein